jgi:D-alanyl-D-alanine carboxypeptidase
VLAIAFKHPPLFPPGQAYDYCNTNYALLGLIIERIEAKPLASIFQARLFGPLGMKETLLPANTSNTLPKPYARGYLYGSSSYALADMPYPADIRAAAKTGTLKPNDDTDQNPSYASAAGGVISTADDLATWIRALVGGKVLNAGNQRRWFESIGPEDPSKPDGQKYGYGIAQISFGPNRLYFHGGEMPGYNSFMGYDPINDVTLIVWANLPLSVDGPLPANTIMLKVLDQIYVESPLKQRQ